MANGLASSRAKLAATQRLPRYSRSAPIVTASLSQMTPASSRLLAETFLLKPEQAARRDIQLRRARVAFDLGRLHIAQGEAFYLVASKFARRFYVIAIHQGDFVCSASDKAVAEKCMDQVIAYVAKQVA